MRISWALLTMNRGHLARECFETTLNRAGRAPDEIVWVDNGSTDGIQDFAREHSDICVLNKKNMGMAHGFNTAWALCTGDLIVQMGAYSKAPEDWLAKMLSVYEEAKPDGVCLFHGPISEFSDRPRGDKGFQNIAGLRCHETIFIESYMFPRSVLNRFGYFDESLDPYWPCDVEYTHRCEAHGFRAITIDGEVVEHCGRGEDIEPKMPNPDGSGLMPYYEWKKAVQWRPECGQRIGDNASKGWPRFNFNQVPM